MEQRGQADGLGKPSDCPLCVLQCPGPCPACPSRPGEKTAPCISLSVLSRRHLIQLPEQPVKMLHILKSHPAAYIRYADICIFQKDGSFLKAYFLYNLCKRFACVFLYDFGTIGLGKMKLRSGMF